MYDAFIQFRPALGIYVVYPVLGVRAAVLYVDRRLFYVPQIFEGASDGK
ncbi:hypothetical protein JCM16163A_42160 [Paenibacillus sp. YK5]|nr:hypothetical protein PN4B1_22630 [Paenibacillus naphthalenovorans]